MCFQGHIPEESEDSEAMLNGGASKVVVVDKETNTEATARSRHRHHAVQEQAARNSALRRSQTFSPSGRVVPQICKVCSCSHSPILNSTCHWRSRKVLL